MSTEARLQNEIQVYGYIRQQTEAMSLEIPIDIMNICLSFYFETFEMLQFDAKYKSETGIILTDDRKCAKREWIGRDWYRYVMADIEPVREGIHCWRVNVKNPKKGWMMFAIGHKQKYKDASFKKGI